MVLPGGGMMRSDDCRRFARRHGMPAITIDALAAYLRAEGAQSPSTDVGLTDTASDE
eukprot:gene4082-4815_t